MESFEHILPVARPEWTGEVVAVVKGAMLVGGGYRHRGVIRVGATVDGRVAARVLSTGVASIFYYTGFFSDFLVVFSVKSAGGATGVDVAGGPVGRLVAKLYGG